MANQERGTAKAAKAVVTQDKTAERDSRELDPRDTDHPTGATQAAENTANDPPG